MEIGVDGTSEEELAWIFFLIIPRLRSNFL